MRPAIASGVMQIVLLASSIARADDPDWKRAVDDPDYSPSTCRLEDDVYGTARREARLPDRSSAMLGFVLGPYGSIGSDRHDATPRDSRDVGFAWGLSLETYFDSLAVVGDVRRWDAADAPRDVPAERTLVDLSLGIYFHHVDMGWVPASLGRRHAVYPAHCGVDRWDVVPLVGVITLVGHDETRPDLDATEIAPVGGLLWRAWEAGPRTRFAAQLRPELFFLPASRRFGARLGALAIVDGWTIGPELFVVGTKELRLTLDLGLSFEL